MVGSTSGIHAFKKRGYIAAKTEEMVRAERLELSRGYHWNLNPARLPISPRSLLNERAIVIRLLDKFKLNLKLQA